MSNIVSHEELKKRVLELEQAASKHKKLEEEFNQIFTMSLDMLCVADITTATFLKVNPAFTKALGYSEEELLGSPFFDFIHPEDIDSTRSVVDEKLCLGTKAINFENRYLCKDGSYRWLSWMSHPAPGKGVTYAVARDITERKLAEERILLKQKQLIAISKIGLLANSTLRLDEILGNVLESITKTLNASAGMILLIDPVTRNLSWGAALGLSKTFVSDVQNHPIRLGEGLTGLIAQTGDPIYIPFDFSHDLRIIRPSVKKEALNSFIGVPLHAADEIVGVMNILTRSPDILTEDDMGLCTAVGSHVGLAIRNAQLFDKQKQTEESLQESEKRFKILSNLTFEGIVIHNDGVVIDSNRALTKMLGYTKEELIGKDLIQLCVLQEYHSTIRENIVKNYAKPYEAMVRRKDGTIFPVELEARDIRNSDLKFRVAAIRDITERKQAEGALRNSKDRFKTAFYTSPDAININRLEDGLYIDINEGFTVLTGYTREETIGKTSSEINVWYNSADRQELVRGLKVKGHYTNLEAKFQRKDGSVTIALMSASIIDLDGVAHILSITRDITERKKAEEKLNKTTYDLGERLKELNCLFHISELFEKENTTEKILQGIADIIPPAWQYPEITCAQIKLGDQSYSSGNFKESKWFQSQKIIASGIIVGEVKVVYCEEKTEIHEGPFFKEERDLLNVIAERIGSFFERKKTEFEKEKLESQLQQAQKMEAIGTLAGGIAHDFNNILGAIIGYTEMARDDSPNGSLIVEDLDKVLEASDRAAGLVKQILAFSRQDETEYILLQPSSIVAKAIAMIRPSLPTTIEITQDIDTKTGHIFGDPTQIHQILINLCTNAFHAMEDTGGRLDISLKEIDLFKDDIPSEPHIDTGTFIQLSVGDSGVGMTQQVKSKIFDPYFTTKRVGKGTGMGLSIVHGIIKNYGGFITLSSEFGKGTVFHVFLPVVNKDVLPAKEAIKQIPVGKEKILFIDDEDVLADMGKNMLERLGYHVTVRTSSLEALETFQNQPDQFDVVITDQTMPGMTGFDLARRMLQIRPDIPIILCTGYSSIISEEKAKSIGVREFALKPVGKRDIAMLIRKVLNGNQV